MRVLLVQLDLEGLGLAAGQLDRLRADDLAAALDPILPLRRGLAAGEAQPHAALPRDLEPLDASSASGAIASTAAAPPAASRPARDDRRVDRLDVAHDVGRVDLGAVGAGAAVDPLAESLRARIASLPSPSSTSTLISAPSRRWTSTLSSPRVALRSSVSVVPMSRKNGACVSRVAVTRGAVRGDDEVLAGRAAVVLRDVGAGAALELVGAVAVVPDDQVVALVAVHRVVAA